MKNVITLGLILATGGIVWPDYGWMPPRTADGKPAIVLRRSKDVFERKSIPRDDPEPEPVEPAIFFPVSRTEEEDEGDYVQEMPPPPPSPEPEAPAQKPESRQKPAGAHELLKGP